jgi:hypothetical protein
MTTNTFYGSMIRSGHARRSVTLRAIVLLAGADLHGSEACKPVPAARTTQHPRSQQGRGLYMKTRDRQGSGDMVPLIASVAQNEIVVNHWCASTLAEQVGIDNRNGLHQKRLFFKLRYPTM